MQEGHSKFSSKGEREEISLIQEETSLFPISLKT